MIQSTRGAKTGVVEALLVEMSLAEKIGQMTQVEKNSITPAAVREFAIGSVLSGGGGNPTPNTPANWAAMVGAFAAAAQETRLAIPLLYGVDAVHGHNNVVGATIFPHNIGLGATRNPALVEEVGRLTAVETRATGANWAFAPCVAVPQDLRWGRVYEAYGEEPGLVADMGAALVRGLQAGDGAGPAGASAVLACAKHFVGDGGTLWGTTRTYDWIRDNWQLVGHHYHIDQGDNRADEATLRAVHLAPYEAAIAAGVRTIMVSFSSWHGVKMHAHRRLLTDVLKGELGFDGFLVSDWMAVDQIDPDYETAVVTAVNAGLDMVMVPFNYRRFIQALTNAVENGRVSAARIDDAVRRILTVKGELGLFDPPEGAAPGTARLGAAAHRDVARRAVRQSLVLLKNDGVLPLAKESDRILLAGRAADDIGLQCGGWTVTWQGEPGAITPGTTLRAALRRAVGPGTEIAYAPDGRFPTDLHAGVGIVVLHEIPYAEGEGDRADLTLSAEEVARLQRVRARCDRLIVILFSGRPRIITEQLPLAEAWIAAWLPGTEGQGLADVLLGDYPFTGQLPFTWPRRMDQIPLGASDDAPLFAYGHGLKEAV